MSLSPVVPEGEEGEEGEVVDELGLGMEAGLAFGLLPGLAKLSDVHSLTPTQLTRLNPTLFQRRLSQTNL